MPEITRTAAEVAAMLEDGREIAFLDVREIVPFGTGHPLLATHLALGHIECEIAGLVPRRDTRVIVTDGGEGLSDVAAHRLARFGYTNVAVLAGGAPAWAAAGLALFPEIEVPSKGFGDFVAHHARPTFITAPRPRTRHRSRGGLGAHRQPPAPGVPGWQHSRQHRRAGWPDAALLRRSGAQADDEGGGELYVSHPRHPRWHEPRRRRRA